MVKKSLLIMMLLALFAPWAANAQTVTVCNGTDNSQYVPFEGYNADSQQHNQMIFPATDLTAMNGKEITQMVFYIDQSASNGSYTAADRLGTWTVSLGETEATTLSGLDNTTTLSQVYQGYFDCSTGTLTLAFSSNYLYQGGNLLVDLNHAASGWNRWYFLGVNQTENTAITRGSLYKFLPKTTFSYQTPPTCPAPGLAAAQDITDSQASFSWTENGSATNWVLQYSTSEEFTNATSVNVQDTPAKAINDFQPLTTYYVRVKADCGEGDQSQWSNVISFSTTAVAEAVGEAWSDDFEGASCGWELINGTLTNKWCWGTAVNNGGTHALYVSNDGGTTNAYTNGSAAMVYATKLLTFADGKYEFSYDWNGNGESTYDYMRVALVPASVTLTAGTSTPSVPSGSFYDNLPTGWIAVDGGGKLNLATAWQSMSATVNVTAGNYYMVLAWRNDGTSGTNPPAAVDNVSINRVACPYDVTGLAVSEITTNSATLSWEGGEATQWQVAYSTASNFEGATEEIVSNASYDMSGLQSSSMYYVKVRAYCGGEDFGTWCQAISFATACDAITTFPWSEDFESYSASSSGIKFEDPCWENIHLEGTGTYFFEVYSAPDGTNGTNGTLGAKQLRLRDMYSGTITKLRLPEMNLPTGDNYLFSIDVFRNTSGSSYTSEGVRVFASTDGEIEDATELGFLYRNCDQTDGRVVTAETSPGWYTYEFPIPMTGTCYIVLRGESQYGGSTYMDNFKVKKELPCVKPSIPTFESSTTTSATLSWTNGAEGQTAWQIAYSTNPNFNPDEVTPVDVTSNPGTINGLTASTTYYAYVRANCGDLGYSEWSTAYCQFATECGAIVVDAANPFTEGFEGDWTPLCWESIPYIDGTTTRQWTKNTNSSYIHTGAGAAYSGYYGPIYLVMPDLQLGTDGDAAQLTFWSYNSYANVYDKNSVVLLDGENEIELWSPESVAQSWVETTIDLTAYMGQTINFAFKYEGNNDHGWYVDDVEVNMIKTFTKTIEAHSAEGEDMSGWYLIASPLYLSIPVESVDHMTDNEFDLYRFNQAPTVNDEGEYLEWENYKSHTTDFLIESGIGYLYANSGDVTLTFTGEPYNSEYDKSIQLSNTEDNPDENMSGWNLVGNPYSVKAYPRRDFYVMNPDGNDIVTPERNYIEPMEGAFVYAEQNGEELTFYKSESSTGNKGALSINVVKAANHRGNGLIDRAVVRFGEGNVLPKFMLNQNHTKVYIPQGNKDCAVVYSEGQGEMPFNFRANENGTYTLSFTAEEVSFSYLHLIDNMTGTDVDLLNAPSYTFNATTTDYSSRFKLVFCTGVNNDSDNFAFFSNSNWIIGNEGEATLQVIDVTGRILSSETVNGSVSKAINAAPGVYMIRLINGENVKVQKIVVR